MKRGRPLFSPFYREGDEGRLWLDSGDIPGAGHQCFGQGVKGVDPELPPAKGAGRGTALSMVPSSLHHMCTQSRADGNKQKTLINNLDPSFIEIPGKNISFFFGHPGRIEIFLCIF